ncbi:glycosyltransferase family 2 protein [Sphingobacterium chuzhouense]|uniref:Glycosyltransferase n=1 Tax=Sphingobacterium chuzhouense TaxID=1742264 RepID=A0ABR7XXL3_9SPHI|nr:glycosyltransferase [Sphingobacterium chuzhouense]MBD1423806.1 glycosyltransferase [Sphingobacterium chuzhouense]
MKITTIITAYNVEKYINRSINSVLSQTFKPYEIIVVDDGSTDNTAELIQAYGDNVIYLHKKNGGASSARNLGVTQAKGDWVAFLDSDDEWIEGHLENFVLTIAKRQTLMWYGAPADSYNERSGKLIHKYKKCSKDLLIDNCYFSDYLNTVPPYGFFTTDTFIIHRQVFEKVGLFDESMKNGQDLDMWFRIGLHYPEVGYTHAAGAKIYRRDKSISFTKKRDFNRFIRWIEQCQDTARKLGDLYVKRAQPRIRFWLERRIRTSITHDDTEALHAIRRGYLNVLGIEYRSLLLLITTFPVLIKIIKQIKIG